MTINPPRETWRQEARELYDRLKESKTMKVGQVSYRYSRTDNGAEFLQKWSPVKL